MSLGLSKFEIIDKIGHGQFSTVYRAKWIDPPDLECAPVMQTLPLNQAGHHQPATGSPATTTIIYENQAFERLHHTDHHQHQHRHQHHQHHQQPESGAQQAHIIESCASQQRQSITRNERYVALKRIKFYDIQNSKARMDYLKEVNLLKQVKHPNIINFNISFIKGNELFIVLELADGGDLSKLIRYFYKKRRLISEHSILKYFTQVCSAVEYIHSKRILHRDIKPANIFMTSNGCVKLGDFGLGRFFSQNTRDAHSIVGTFYYMSPERIQECGYSFSSDVWSLGCVLYELITLDSPFSIMNHGQYFNNNTNHNTLHYDHQTDQVGKRPLMQANQPTQQPPTEQQHNPYNLTWLINRIIRAEYPSLDGYKHISSRLRCLANSCLNPVQEARPNMQLVCSVVSEAYRVCQSTATPPMTPPS